MKRPRNPRRAYTREGEEMPDTTVATCPPVELFRVTPISLWRAEGGSLASGLILWNAKFWSSRGVSQGSERG